MAKWLNEHHIHFRRTAISGSSGRDAAPSTSSSGDNDESSDADFGARAASLQGLLSRLGAGLDDLMPSSSWARTRMKTVLAGLKADDDMRQLESLTELCEVRCTNRPFAIALA
jgi:E3 ubiquitin-protein ligase TRIP12